MQGLVLVGAGLACTGGEDDADNEAVQSKGFRKDEDEDHAHKQLWLLRVGPAEEAKARQNQIIILQRLLFPIVEGTSRGNRSTNPVHNRQLKEIKK